MRRLLKVVGCNLCVCFTQQGFGVCTFSWQSQCMAKYTNHCVPGVHCWELSCINMCDTELGIIVRRALWCWCGDVTLVCGAGVPVPGYQDSLVLSISELFSTRCTQQSSVNSRHWGSPPSRCELITSSISFPASWGSWQRCIQMLDYIAQFLTAGTYILWWDLKAWNVNLEFVFCPEAELTSLA